MLKVIPLFSGSSGNSTLLSYRNEHILIDAGVSYTRIKKELEKHSLTYTDISKIFVTHEHSDHIKALDTIALRENIPIYMNTLSASSLKSAHPDLLANAIVEANAGSVLETDSFKVSIFRTPHDSAGSVGYRFDCVDGDSFALATDMGYISKSIASYLFGANTVIIESNHDIQMLKNGPYPYILKERIMSQLGHLSNDACAQFVPYLVKNGTKRIMLAHLSKQNNAPEIAYTASKIALERENLECNLEVISPE